MNTSINNIEFSLKFNLIKSNNALKLLSKCLKNDDDIYGCILPTKMELDNYIICIVNKFDQNIVSFIWFKICLNDDSNIIKLKSHYSHIIYSYTFKKYRNMGFNKKLRLWIETFCKKNKIKYIISISLPDSNSKYILEQMGYVKINSYYLKKIL
jgi:hypothetical protein